MRRAVSACTSPEVFFGNYLNPQEAAAAYGASPADPLSLAMDTLQLSSPVVQPTRTEPQVPDMSQSQ